MYSAMAGAVMWWSRYSICGSMCGGSLLIPAFSGDEISIRRRGISALPLFRRLHQLRRIGTHASGVAGLRVRQSEIVAHRLQPGDRRGGIVLRLHHQRAGHAEHRIAVDVLIVAEVERRDQFAKTL